MGRIVAIDYGARRVGLAATDPLQLIATPVGVVETSRLIGYLHGYTSRHTVEKWALGLPRKMNGQYSDIKPEVDRLAATLSATFPAIPIAWVDERLTSVIALQTLRKSGMNKKKRSLKGQADPISATLILQSYLERQKRIAPHTIKDVASPTQPAEYHG